MVFEKTGFNGLFLIKPRVFSDERGFFMEAFSQRCFQEAGQHFNFVQDNHSSSIRGVLRGLHYQNSPHSQTKLVRVLLGEIIDIVVDLRVGEATFGKPFMGVLSSENKQQLLIPKGFAHGFVVVSDIAEVLYKCDDYYYPETEGGINIRDESLGIRIPELNSHYIQSEKDKNLPPLSKAVFKF